MLYYVYKFVVELVPVVSGAYNIEHYTGSGRRYSAGAMQLAAGPTALALTAE